MRYFQGLRKACELRGVEEDQPDNLKFYTQSLNWKEVILTDKPKPLSYDIYVYLHKSGGLEVSTNPFLRKDELYAQKKVTITEGEFDE